LRQAIVRINIHRSKKLNAIAKKKDDIGKHLESGNEVNAKIWVRMQTLSLLDQKNLFNPESVVY
jgi:competence CoiA-like predicted nuclease